METFRSDELKHKAYRSLFLQKGGNVGIEHFLNMKGEGLGNYFGTSIRKSVPLTNTIKGINSRTKLMTVANGTKRKRHTNKKSKQIIVHTPHKKARGKWPNL
jgi:hypothetical protein